MDLLRVLRKQRRAHKGPVKPAHGRSLGMGRGLVKAGREAGVGKVGRWEKGQRGKGAEGESLTNSSPRALSHSLTYPLTHLPTCPLSPLPSANFALMPPMRLRKASDRATPFEQCLLRGAWTHPATPRAGGGNE